MASSEKARGATPKLEMSPDAHQQALDVLNECKRELADISELIQKLKDANPERLLNAMAKLEPKRKAVLSTFVERGEIHIRLREIQAKEPRYIN